MVSKVLDQDPYFKTIKKSHVEIYVRKCLNSYNMSIAAKKKLSLNGDGPDAKKPKSEFISKMIRIVDDLTLKNFLGYKNEKNVG